jgi:hypothetical protein
MALEKKLKKKWGCVNFFKKNLIISLNINNFGETPPPLIISQDGQQK